MLGGVIIRARLRCWELLCPAFLVSQVGLIGIDTMWPLLLRASGAETFSEINKTQQWIRRDVSRSCHAANIARVSDGRQQTKRLEKRQRFAQTASPRRI